MNRLLEKQSGISLVEVLVVVGILGLISVGIVTLFTDTFSLNRNISNQLSVSGEARRALKTMTAEMRTASPSSNGAYAITQTATSSFTFYSNVDSDSYKERIRYFASGTVLYRGLIKPSGSPLAYNNASETITSLVRGLVTGTSTPIFVYFDSTYAGTSTPTTTPAIADVRLVRTTFMIDIDITTQGLDGMYTTQVTFRNLKDNL